MAGRVKRHSRALFAGRRAERHGLTGPKPPTVMEWLLDTLWSAARIPAPKKFRREKTMRRRLKVVVARSIEQRETMKIPRGR